MRVDVVTAFAAVEVGDEPARVGRELRGIGSRLGLDPLRELGRSVVRVDEPVEQAAETQSELEVALDDVAHRTSTLPVTTRGAVDVKAVQHVALTVDDLDAALRFYALLGFDPLPRPDFGIPGAWLQAGDAQIHLLELDDPAPHALNHVALWVSDVDAAAAAVSAATACSVDGPSPIGDSLPGVRQGSVRQHHRAERTDGPVDPTRVSRSRRAWCGPS